LFAKGIDELKKVVIKDAMDRMQQKMQATQKRRKVDDPVQVYADSTQDEQGSNKFDADLNHPPLPDNIEPTIDRTEDAAGSFKDSQYQQNQDSTWEKGQKVCTRRVQESYRKRKQQGYADCAERQGIQDHFVQTETR
jgi:hypothetical protein